MRGAVHILILSLLSLTACEKDFDEKYQDNLEKLNAEAEAIEAGVDRTMAEQREADKIIGATEEPSKWDESDR